MIPVVRTATPPPITAHVTVATPDRDLERRFLGRDQGAENVILSCSGVALAETDEECGQFKKGYAMTFESKEKPVPAECK